MSTFVSRSGNASFYITQGQVVFTRGTVQMSMSSALIEDTEAQRAKCSVLLDGFEQNVVDLALENARISVASVVDDEKDVLAMLYLAHLLDGSSEQPDSWKGLLDRAIRVSSGKPLVISHANKEMTIYPDFDRDLTLRDLRGAPWAGTMGSFLVYLCPSETNSDEVKLPN